MPNDARKAEEIKRNAGLFYGTAGPAFVKAIVEKAETPSGLRELVQTQLAESIARLTKPGATAAEARAIKRFALAEAAALLAVRAGVLPYEERRVKEAIVRVLGNTLESLSDIPDSERGVIAVRDFILANMHSRFIKLQDESEDRKVLRDIAGYIGTYGYEGQMYFLLPAAFREACGGANPRIVASLLRKRNLLKTRDGDHNTVYVTAYGQRISVYGIKPEIIGSESVDSE
jgi:putative DNA primase/helicase